MQRGFWNGIEMILKTHCIFGKIPTGVSWSLTEHYRDVVFFCFFLLFLWSESLWSFVVLSLFVRAGFSSAYVKTTLTVSSRLIFPVVWHGDIAQVKALCLLSGCFLILVDPWQSWDHTIVSFWGETINGKQLASSTNNCFDNQNCFEQILPCLRQTQWRLRWLKQSLFIYMFKVEKYHQRFDFASLTHLHSMIVSLWLLSFQICTLWAKQEKLCCLVCYLHEAGSNLQWCFDSESLETSLSGDKWWKRDSCRLSQYGFKGAQECSFACNLHVHRQRPLWTTKLLCGFEHFVARPGDAVLLLLSDVGWQKRTGVSAALSLSQCQYVSMRPRHTETMLWVLFLHSGLSGHCRAQKWLVHHRLALEWLQSLQYVVCRHMKSCIPYYTCFLRWWFHTVRIHAPTAILGSHHVTRPKRGLRRHAAVSRSVSESETCERAALGLRLYITWSLPHNCMIPSSSSQVSVNDPDRYPHLLSVKNCFIRGEPARQ